MDGKQVDIKSLIVDPENFVPELSEHRVRMLFFELESLFEEYERENVIMYLASNYSVNKHLSFTALRGMHDEEIMAIMEETRDYLREYLAELKKKKNQ